ncbi:BAG domain-containing protein Samui isoform X2 [Agrilus planipennis]|uniref:BAG domain-containing protein Samui isoform X2 n=1 Tax=Agrilus planipennis TaxID=224129 RepID=A0A1W4WZI7_AGRPL|nr:BAG domain-containing protein Samui isoform X2 [Agrilus planipennis]
MVNSPLLRTNTSIKSGFPFDEADFDRSDASFKSHLDDLAKRHPEIAQHFNKEFPFRSNTWGHKRRGSSSGKDEPKPSFPTDDFPDLKRFTDRPFGSRFERFGFPFNRTFDGEPHFRQEFQQPSNEQPSGSSQRQQQTSNNQTHQQPSTSSNESRPTETRAQESFDKPPQVPNQDRGRKQHPYVQQSNTTDLGQKQEAVNEPRGQRSMSAPPENRSNHPRYVSSINIPINVERGGDGMGSQQSQQHQQPQQQQQQSQPNNQSQNQSTHERVIPIMVEGRDEPVIPRNVHQTFSSPPKPEPERVFSGARPSQFAGWPRNDTHFFRNDPYFQQPPSYQHHQQQQQHKPPEEPFKQQHVPPQHTAAASPPPQQQNRQPTPPKQEQAHSPTPPPSKPQGKLTPIEQIEAIQKDVANLMTQIENFNGKTKDKQYLYLDEMLTRNLIKLDDVQTDGQDELRQMRKEAIRSVQRCISVLESKVSSDKKEQEMDVEQNKNETNQSSEEQTMEVEKTEQQVKSNEECNTPVTNKDHQNPSNDEQNKTNEELTALEVSGKARSGSEVKIIEDKKEGSPMDVNVESDSKPKTEENTNNKQETSDIKTEEKKEESAQDNSVVEVKETKDKKEEKKDKKKVKKKEKSEKK